ncbi:MAG: hypothetical protein IJ702_06890 [Fretibacterium sp.]|nr:hypothetical protein [Fretibacterium sp.]
MKDRQWDEVFSRRIAKHYDELKWLYGELYGDGQQAFDDFCDMLHNYYSQRGDALKEWDGAREVVPDWYTGNEILGMQMYTDCFAGTLKGVRRRLEYIRECRVNCIHLMPLLESPKEKSDGGYAVSDFRRVQPELGTMRDLAELAEDCHRLGISVCLDFVMNHTSEEHEWARRARAGEKAYQDRYFFFDNWDVPNQYERTLPQVFPQTAPGNFTWCPVGSSLRGEEAGKVVMTTFYPYQGDLNYGNPVVFNDMTANMLYLCNQGVDIIRLDAVPYIWKTLGTNCRNLPQVHTLVRIMRMAAEIVCPGTLLLGEVVMEPSKVVPYFGTLEKPECHMLYNVTTMASTWHTVATKDVRLLRHQMELLFALPKQYVFLNYLRCHDDIGWGLDYAFLRRFAIDEVAHKKYLNDYLRGALEGSPSRGELYNDDPRLGDARLCGTTASLCGIEAAEAEGNLAGLDLALRLDTMLHAFLFTQSGIPILYSGDEIGQFNDYTYHQNPQKAGDSRWLHRGAFNWDHARKRKPRKDVGASGGQSTPLSFDVEAQLFQRITELARLRAEYRVFEGAADMWTVETGNDHVLGIGRYYRGEKLVALFNFSEAEQPVQLGPEGGVNEGEVYRDMLGGTKRDTGAITLPGYGFLWLMTSFN